MIPWRQVFSLTSPSGRNGRLSTFIFHRVTATRDEVLDWDPDAQEFERMMGWIKNWFNVLPLDEAIVRLKHGDLPQRAAAITFDDGYADNFTTALPILKAHGLSATFFIATGYLDGGRMWNDTIVESVRRCTASILDLSSLGLGIHPLDTPEATRKAIQSILGGIKYKDHSERLDLVASIATTTRSELPTDLMMTTAQVKAMREEGMLIGAHTVRHPILARLPTTEVAAEVAHSKDHLESVLGEPVTLFAYPNGKPNADYRAVDAEIVRRTGFHAAMTTAWGVADSRADLMQLPRFTPWDRTRSQFGLRLLRNLVNNGRARASQIAHNSSS